MRLQQVRERIAQAQQNVRDIAPKCACYLVAMINDCQLEPSDLTRAGLGLAEHEEIFVPDRASWRLKRLAKRLSSARERLDDLRDQADRASRRDPHRPAGRREARIARCEHIVEELRRRVLGTLEEVEVLEPQCELRFVRLDMAAVQEIKQHPIVQWTAKTEMSEASVRVVVG